MATRGDLIGAVGGRYKGAVRTEKKLILDEFTAATGLHRKHAMRLLRSDEAKPSGEQRTDRRRYDDAVRAALVMLWEASDRVCGKRLKASAPLLMDAMERHGHLRLEPEVKAALLVMSAATMDRALREMKTAHGGALSRKPRPSIRKAVPVRTFSDWDDSPPGFFEADLVWHRGPRAKGGFVQTLVLTDS